ncbi:MAG TPA: hypothetical protein VGZ02_11540 [Candidatus Baltobacteraceae bacterium]|nr:hypothetical protein [Candidatus Baltobacteraceae bacterium]
MRERVEFGDSADAVMKYICAGVLELPPEQRQIPNGEWINNAATTVWLFDYPVDRNGRTIVDVYLQR